jgi:glutamyl-tRNA reductase
MLDGYHILTLTHHDAPLDMIGQLAIRGESPALTLDNLKDTLGWDELYYLSTCNRTLFLFYTPHKPDASLRSRFCEIIRPDFSSHEVEEMASKIRVLNGQLAVLHLWEVAASMDSLVVGEREIIRQLRQGYEQNQAWGLIGDHIRLLMRFTFETAKEIYTNTGIGEKAVSIVALAFKRFQAAKLPTNARILFIGAGQTNALFFKFLLKAGFQNITVFNRSLDRAESLVSGHQGTKALLLEELPHYSEGFDAMIVCTGATEPVVTPTLYASLVAHEATKHKVVIDLSIPNNVDRQIVGQYPMDYIEIEGLRSLAQENMAYREQEKQSAVAILQRRLMAFRDQWHERQVEKSMAHIPMEVRAVKDRAVQEVFARQIATLDPHAQSVLQEVLDYMEKKCVAIPMKAAKMIALRGIRKQAQPVETDLVP